MRHSCRSASICQPDVEAGYKSLLAGEPPEVRCFPTIDEEGWFICETVRNLLKDKPAEEICLVARTKKLLQERYQPALKAAKIPNVILDQKNDPGEPGVRLATMHRVKGLEFPVMILAGVSDRVVPHHVAAISGDPIAKSEHEERERSLLFVAATRARDHLIVTACGSPSPFLMPLMRQT